MGFKTAPGEPLHGFARYVAAEHAIEFVHDEARAAVVGLGRDSLASALEFGTLTLTARTTDGRIGFPEGYHPRDSWAEAPVSAPSTASGLLYWEPAGDLIRGGALGIAQVMGVATTFDPHTGWLALHVNAGDVAAGDRPETVEFCDGVIAGLLGPRLVTLWIRLREMPGE